VKNAEEWKTFCDKIGMDERRFLRKNIEIIKTQLNDIKVTKGDHAIIKLDEKHNRLHFYQEGADILPMETYLRRTLRGIEDNPLYARVFGGQGLGKLPEGASRISQSQLAAITVFATTEDLEKAGRKVGTYEPSKPFLKRLATLKELKKDQEAERG
jgi:hypothetical protein